jgi:hypothetical protein
VSLANSARANESSRCLAASSRSALASDPRMVSIVRACAPVLLGVLGELRAEQVDVVLELRRELAGQSNAASRGLVGSQLRGAARRRGRVGLGRPLAARQLVPRSPSRRRGSWRCLPISARAASPDARCREHAVRWRTLATFRRRAHADAPPSRRHLGGGSVEHC